MDYVQRQAELQRGLDGVAVDDVAAMAHGLRGQTDEERRVAVERVIQGVSRTTRLVEQLLTVARLNLEQDVLDGERVDLRSVAISTLGRTRGGRHR